jgi:RNA-directed DNA polymerase
LVSSRDMQRQQKTPTGAYPAEAKQEESSIPLARTGKTFREGDGSNLMERVIARDNMLQALRRVESNQGAPGIDKVTVGELQAYCRQHWQNIRQELLADTYKPQPVLRVTIPKPGGGVRDLGIPTVIDRLIQQALLQQLTPLFDPDFSDSSHGFRPGRSPQAAVKQAKQYVEAGYGWVVDIDLDKFFDRVNHDMLMARVARKVTDKRVLRLIRRYLQSGVMINGVIVETEAVTPQGGPLSPLLSNIVLDDLDKELEKRGHKFVRYADDCNIYVKTPRAGERVMESVRRFIEKKLKLKVNEAKSAVGRPKQRKFLGFSILGSGQQTKLALAPQTKRRFKQRMRELTRRSNGKNMAQRLEAINRYLQGWLSYYSLADTKKVLKDLESWLKRRLRSCQWAEWQKPKARYRGLRTLGLSHAEAYKLANTSKGPWRIAGGPLNWIMPNKYWREQGLLDLMERYHKLRFA